MRPARSFAFDILAASRTLTAHRTATSGQTGFNGTFSVPSMRAPLHGTGDSVTLDLYIDQSSVELFTADGTLSMTNLVFPKSIYRRVSVSGVEATARYRTLQRIWQ
jgi:fructan beta-fructosidase